MAPPALDVPPPPAVEDDEDIMRSERRQRRTSRVAIGSSLLPPRSSGAATPFTNGTISSSFLISAALSSLLIYLISIVRGNYESYSPYRNISSRRYGLGAGDADGDLRSALRRGGEGRAAVAIIRVIDVDAPSSYSPSGKDDVGYLVQVKSHDYPIEAFRGAVCLLGGNANVDDATPLDTLRRELGEELFHPTWVDDLGRGGGDGSSSSAVGVIDDSGNGRGNSTYAPSSLNNDTIVGGVTIRYLGASMHYHTSTLIDSRYPYAFLCALYEVTIRSDMVPAGIANPRGANVREGRTVLLREDQLIRHSRYAWGYEHTIEKYFGRKVTNKQAGSAVSVVDERTWKDAVWTPGKL
ncbi:hypothetical protein ACHAXA_000599 [Cyclostephanos tholiformis]|uniref:Nudix hydrolase domain-containing protein n=1 Tax=Cyclostephanos tholiformis TaxID=382380 RepID=A0ABD3SR66_9STRA